MVKPRPIRVAVDAHSVGRRATGNETYVVGLVDALAEQEEVEPIALLDEDVAWPGSAVPAIRRLRARNRLARIPIELAVASRRARADVLHVQYVAPPIAGVPVVTAIHDLSFEDVPGIFGRATELRLRLTVRASARRSAAVTTISEFSRERLLDRYGLSPDSVFLTPIAVDPRWRPLDAPERAVRLAGLPVAHPFVLAVGNLHPRKNLARLVHAVAAVRSSGVPELRLVLVGQPSWHASEVDAAVDAVDGRDWVTFTGYIDDAVLLALYGEAHVVAYVSLYEGLGLPVLEALACGAVVVASSTTAVPEAVGDAGVLVDPTLVDSIAAGILSAATDSALRARLAAAGPAWAGTFTRKRFADGAVQAYRSAIAST
jgi:glycosyltransferase involved in cell wall biosynthesis